MNQSLLVSADSHVVEPPEVFAGVARRFGFDAPRMIETPERGQVLETGFAGTYQPGRFATAGLPPHSPEYDARERSGYARAALSDVSGRLTDMDADGVGAEILFPSLIARCLTKQALGGDVVQALTASYNDWLADYCSGARDRLFPIACLPPHDLDAALRELERVKRSGHVGVLLPSGAPDDRPYSDAVYDRLWATAEALSMPIAFHAGFMPARGNRPAAFKRNGLGFTMLHVDAMETVSDLIFGGVCERFPQLRFVLTEFETGWIAHFLMRSERRALRKMDPSASKLRFSEAWRHSFAATFEADALGIASRDIIGVENLLWANDYPHGNSVWPRSEHTVDSIMGKCSSHERRAMTALNTIALYDLPIDADGRALPTR